jgi:hypothetical protein
MFAPSRRLTFFAIIAACALAACRGETDNSALNQDSALSRDLARAGTDSTTQPALSDVPPAAVEAPPPVTPPRSTPRPKTPAPKAATPPPPAPTPAPTPAPPAKEEPKEPPTGAIAAGTTLKLASANKVCTNTNKVGDRFSATLTEPVTGSNGAVIPSGSTVTIEVTTLHRSENANDRIVMGFRVVSLTVGGKTYYPEAEVVTAAVDRVAASSRSDAAKKVAGGAVIGAIIGQVVGRDRKGTLIGAAAGAAAGGAAAAATADHDGCVQVGAPITVKLNQALTITVAD